MQGVLGRESLPALPGPCLFSTKCNAHAHVRPATRTLQAPGGQASLRPTGPTCNPRLAAASRRAGNLGQGQVLHGRPHTGAPPPRRRASNCVPWCAVSALTRQEGLKPKQPDRGAPCKACWVGAACCHFLALPLLPTASSSCKAHVNVVQAIGALQAFRGAALSEFAQLLVLPPCTPMLAAPMRPHGAPPGAPRACLRPSRVPQQAPRFLERQATRYGAPGRGQARRQAQRGRCGWAVAQ